MTLAQQLEALFEQLSPKIADAFRAAIQDVTDNALLQQVVTAIEQGDIDGAFKALGFSPASFNDFIALLGNIFESAGLATMASFPRYVAGADGIKTVLRFNVRDKRAEEWLRAESSTLITNIEQDARLAVRNALEAGMAEGRNPLKVALDIVGRYNNQTGHREGGVVGLGQREELWSRNARQRLLTLDSGYFGLELRDKRFDATVQAAIDAQKPLPLDVVDKLTDRYRANALKHRGDNIGRTEALAALNRSEWLATVQAVEAGDLKGDAVTREWDSAGDNRVRPAHRVMNGQRVGLQEAFTAPNGEKLMHPGDTTLGAGAALTSQCRCRVRTIVDWFAGVK